MDVAALIGLAASHGASDLHLEPGLPPTLRIRGTLRGLGEPLHRASTQAAVEFLLGEDDRERLAARQSVDLARVVGGIRCRINVLHSARGPGLAIRLLSDEPVTVRSLNLHPDFEQLVERRHGLVLVSGPTGCGKSSTLAALLQHVNVTSASHIVTVEQPIEFVLRPEKAFIRQREVGRDTPSFEQALYDAMREDIDVLMVGELRARETMRLTLDACETGHLVLATLHASTVTEALQRIVSAFPALEQPSVCAQLADCLVAVITQGLQYRDELGIRVPECELLMGTTGVRAIIRQAQLFKLATALETGGGDGMWTLPRYRDWLDARQDWSLPDVRHRTGDAFSPDDADDVLVIRPEDASYDLLSDEPE